MGEEEKYISNPNPGGGCVNLKNLNTRVKADYEGADQETRFKMSGIGCGKSVIDIQPNFREAPAEYVRTNGRNAWIVLGVDRPSTITSGYGGRGCTQAAAIDLVAGRMGGYVRDTDENGKPVYANNDFVVDASRIYISQKSDIDDYFDLPEIYDLQGPAQSWLRTPPYNRAAIALKSDEIRIISRGGIKLVTGVGQRWASGEKRTERRGIDLIGPADPRHPNLVRLEPLVKGQSLINALGSNSVGDNEGFQTPGSPAGLADMISDLREILLSYVKYQGGINQTLLTHTHPTPFFGAPTAPPFTAVSEMVKGITQQLAQTEVSIVTHGTNLAAWENNYLNPMMQSFVNSKWNKTN